MDFDLTAQVDLSKWPLVTPSHGIIATGDQEGVPTRDITNPNHKTVPFRCEPRIGAIYENKIRMSQLEKSKGRPGFCNFAKVEWPDEAVKKLAFDELNGFHITNMADENVINEHGKKQPLKIYQPLAEGLTLAGYAKPTVAELEAQLQAAKAEEAAKSAKPKAKQDSENGQPKV